MTPTVLFLIAATIGADHLGPGNHTRKLTVFERERSYLVHVPPQYDSGKPTPIVLIFHGAGTNSDITVPFTVLNRKSDEAGFIPVYPNGTGATPQDTWQIHQKHLGQRPDVGGL